MTERATRINASALSPRARAHAAGDEILLLNGPSLNLPAPPRWMRSRRALPPQQRRQG